VVAEQPKARGETPAPLQCPAAPQHWPEAKVFAVSSDGRTVPVMPVPVTPELLARCAPRTPRQILRMAATCVKERCRHWDATQPGAEGDGVCTLVQRVIGAGPADLAEVAAQGGDSIGPDIGFAPLQPCAIRGRCRWWAQEGRRACEPCGVTPTDLGELPQDAESEPLVGFF
jgi:hypothetical protein